MRRERVQWSNIQALVMSGFPALRYAAYVLFRFEEGPPGPQPHASEWLWRLCQRVTTAAHVGTGDVPQACRYAASLADLKTLTERAAPPADIWALNVAFTPSGLSLLGATDAELGRFSAEFQNGMAPPPDADGNPRRRSSLLGDLGANSPQHWSWGGWSACNRFDGVLMLYARSPASLRRLVAAELEAMRGVASPVWCRTDAGGCARFAQGRIYPRAAGHFGLVDGISQPVIEGTPRARSMPRSLRAVSVVAAGEFVLGYRDTRGAVVRYDDPAVPGSRDLGRNGSYLAVRQLEQDVEGYRQFVRDAALRLLGRDDQDAFDWVAAKLLGRRPSGEPLIPPPADCRDEEQRLNGFRFSAEDRDGLACPLGSHIRRANPRDVVGPDPETALRLSRMHRLIRRGRSYGPRERRPGAGAAGVERGLFFICLQASLAGQFELVQHSWINNPQFEDLGGDVDPLSHVSGDTLTIQSRPSNLRLTGRTPFVRVKGGGYFFLPGLNAMRALSEPGLAHGRASQALAAH
ncbi:MAG: peroxidase [Hyphomicrobiaceae bacterium]|nr:peroxidase [Hyphomicrobiaceae bacterium]